jgi:N-acetylglutamate synthase-like GNAT family acetyltransferase
VKPFTKTDLDLLPDLQPEDWSDIKPAFEFYTISSFCFPIKIIAANRMVGIGTTIIHHDVAWLAHIIVHKQYRKKGIGQLITETLVNSLPSENCETIYLLATDLGAPVYEKVGFITETEYLFFKDIKITEHQSAQVQVEPYREEFKEQIAEIDSMNSGENRFFHLDDHLQAASVYCEDKIVKGFYLPGFGEGLIIANSPVAGLELLKLHLKSNQKIVFPKDNLVAASYLHQYGFKEMLTGKRMRLGKKREVNFKNIYNRIGGNLG